MRLKGRSLFVPWQHFKGWRRIVEVRFPEPDGTNSRTLEIPCQILSALHNRICSKGAVTRTDFRELPCISVFFRLNPLTSPPQFSAASALNCCKSCSASKFRSLAPASGSLRTCRSLGKDRFQIYRNVHAAPKTIAETHFSESRVDLGAGEGARQPLKAATLAPACRTAVAGTIASRCLGRARSSWWPNGVWPPNRSQPSRLCECLQASVKRTPLMPNPTHLGPGADTPVGTDVTSQKSAAFGICHCDASIAPAPSVRHD